MVQRKNKHLVIGVLVILLALSLYLVLGGDLQFTKKNTSKHGLAQNDRAEEAFGKQVGTLPLFSSACFPTYKQTCFNGECETTSDLGTSFSLVNKLSATTVSRCDERGCDTYDAQYYASGVYENYQPEQPRGFFIKKEGKSMVDTETTSYTEIVTVGLTSVLYAGYCRDVK